MENISIRKLSPADLVALQKISQQTFTEAFAAGNTEENLKQYLGEAFSLGKLGAELNDPNSAFYFAILDGDAIGYIKLNTGRSQTELQDDKGLEIERIYVLHEMQGKRVGQLLYEHAVAIAGQRDAHYIWLGVWEENIRAINFYKKNGFVQFSKHAFKVGDDVQTDIMMKRMLK